MANIIDAFFVEIGLDPTKFRKGREEIEKGFASTKDAAKKAANDIEQSGTRAADSIGKLKSQVLALFAVFTGGVALKDFVQQMTQADSQLGRLASTLGISGRTLSTFEGAAELAGGSAQGMASAFQGLTMEIQNWQATGQTSLIASFQAIEKAGGKLLDVSKPVDQIMRDIIEDLGHIAAKGNPAYASYLAQRLGMQDLAAALIQGGDAWQNYLTLADKYAATNGDLNAARDRLRIWRELKLLWDSIGRELLTTFTPALIAAGDAVRKFGQWAKDNPEEVKRAFEALLTVTIALAAALGTAGLAGAFALLLDPINLVVAAVGTLIYVGLKMTGEWDKYGSRWHEILTGMTEDAHRLRKELEDKIAGGLAGLIGGVVAGGLAFGPLGAIVGGAAGAAIGYGIGGLGTGGGGATGGAGSRASRNNNPGNLKFGDLARQFGATGADEKGFAIFPDAAKGRAAMESLIRQKGVGHTLAEIGQWYAEGDPAWASGVGSMMGVDPHRYKMQEGDVGRFGDAIQRQEGFRAGAGNANVIPSQVLDKARQIALQSGPGGVQAFMASQGYPMNGNWCGEFAAAVIKSVGGTPPKNAAIASNWRNWGQARAGTPQPGDVAVKKAGATGATGSHVTIVESYNPATGTFTGIGGNQGSARSRFGAGGYEFRAPMPTESPNDRVRGGFDSIKGGDKSSAIMGGSALASSASYDNSRQQVTTTTMGDVHVHTAATDSLGIAKDLRDHLQRVAFAGQLDYGINGA